MHKKQRYMKYHMKWAKTSWTYSSSCFERNLSDSDDPGAFPYSTIVALLWTVCSCFDSIYGTFISCMVLILLDSNSEKKWYERKKKLGTPQKNGIFLVARPLRGEGGG